MCQSYGMNNGIFNEYEELITKGGYVRQAYIATVHSV